jgi:hypothetical protein
VGIKLPGSPRRAFKVVKKGAFYPGKRKRRYFSNLVQPLLDGFWSYAHH